MAVLTDYERIPQFMPDMEISRVLERTASGAVVEQEAVSRFMLFSKRVHLVLDVVEDKSGDSLPRSLRQELRDLFRAPGPSAQHDSLTRRRLSADGQADRSRCPAFVLKRLLKRDAAQLDRSHQGRDHGARRSCENRRTHICSSGYSFSRCWFVFHAPAPADGAVVRAGGMGRRREAERASRSQSRSEDRRDRSDREAGRRADRRQDRARVDLQRRPSRTADQDARRRSPDRALQERARRADDRALARRARADRDGRRPRDLAARSEEGRVVHLRLRRARRRACTGITRT